jgi:uncharacterized protein with GYD domain
VGKYLIEAAYSHEGLKGLVKDGGSGRRTAVDAAVKALGGRIESMYYGFGTSDVYVIVEAPDNVSAAALALAVGATGALAHYKTTVLLSTDEVDQAAKKSSGLGYRPPGH